MAYIYAMPLIFRKLAEPKKSKIYPVYWRFAVERQDIFFKRLITDYPLTKDPILLKYKFTNAYRAADRVSQYLVRNVIYSGNNSLSDTFFRIILFKIFNKIETWEWLQKNIGEINFTTYSFDLYDYILGELVRQNRSIYSGAYIMASGKSAFGLERKYQNHLRLIELFMKDNVADQLQNSKSLTEVYNTLLKYPTIGKFLGFQYSIDINYSEIINFSEMDFVVAGPGAKDGISKCFTSKGDYSDEDIIKWMADNQLEELKTLNLDFKNLWGRPLQLIDCQNLFCEVDKYSRVAHPEIVGTSYRKKIKQKFFRNSEPVLYFFPPKWGINDKIPLPVKHV